MKMKTFVLASHLDFSHHPCIVKTAASDWLEVSDRGIMEANKQDKLSLFTCAQAGSYRKHVKVSINVKPCVWDQQFQMVFRETLQSTINSLFHVI